MNVRCLACNAHTDIAGKLFYDICHDCQKTAGVELVRLKRELEAARGAFDEIERLVVFLDDAVKNGAGCCEAGRGARLTQLREHAERIRNGSWKLEEEDSLARAWAEHATTKKDLEAARVERDKLESLCIEHEQLAEKHAAETEARLRSEKARADTAEASVTKLTRERDDNHAAYVAEVGRAVADRDSNLERATEAEKRIGELLDQNAKLIDARDTAESRFKFQCRVTVGVQKIQAMTQAKLEAAEASVARLTQERDAVERAANAWVDDCRRAEKRATEAEASVGALTEALGNARTMIAENPASPCVGHDLDDFDEVLANHRAAAEARDRDLMARTAGAERAYFTATLSGADAVPPSATTEEWKAALEARDAKLVDEAIEAFKAGAEPMIRASGAALTTTMAAEARALVERDEARAQVAKLRDMLSYLNQYGFEPDGSSDNVYIRIEAVLAETEKPK